MLGSNYWNGDTSLLFGAERQAPVSSQWLKMLWENWKASVWCSRDVLLYLQLEQEHLQTLPGTMQRLGPADGDVACTSREFS
jgi:hypothetical protein